MINLMGAVLAALGLVLAFPRFDLGFLAWVSLIPLLAAVRDGSARAALGLSFVSGCVFFAGIFHWILVIQGFRWFHFLALMVYLGSYFALFGLGLNVVLRQTRVPLVIAAPVLWVAVEFLRSNAGFLALPWGLLAHTQYRTLSVIQVSALTGSYGVSFLIVLVNGALLEAWDNRFRPTWSAGLAALALAGVVGYGLFETSRRMDGPTFTVAVIQGSIPQSIKWDARAVRENLNKHADLTRQAAADGAPSLIVWPEVAVTTPLNHDPNTWKTVSSLARETGAHLLVGSAERPKLGSKEFTRSHHYNTAFLVTPEGRLGRFYNKIVLLPFAEYLPLAGRFPWPASLAKAAGDFLPGRQHTIFDIDGVRFAGLICWESLFADHFRRFIEKGAVFAVNMTNEAWFEETAAPYQFLAMNVMRAVENRVAIVRSANTGISCAIDPHGRILQRVSDRAGKDIFVEGHLTQAVPLRRETTLYTRCGDVAAYLAVGASLLMLGTALWGRIRAAQRTS